jgi:hypothetical protein
MNKENQEQFNTSSFYLACFLICRGKKLIKLERDSNSKRAVFIFQFDPEMKELVNQFNFNNNVKVNVREFIDTQKWLKNALFDEFNNKYKK